VTVAGQFQYTPSVADVVFLSPPTGSVQGGTQVILIGSGFSTVTSFGSRVTGNSGV
jgi:hypothetical protein